MQNNVFVRIRQTAGLTQKEFAKALGVGSVMNWEQGKHFPNYTSMRKLMDFCRHQEIDCSEVKAAWSTWQNAKMPKKSRIRKSRKDDLPAVPVPAVPAPAEENPFVLLRKQTGLSQQEFAVSLGVKSVVNWERGRCFPNYKSMKKIARYCEENGLDYSEVQEAWKQKNRTTCENKCSAQQQRWQRIKNTKCPKKDKIAMIHEYLSQCSGDSEFEIGMRYAAAQMLEILERKGPAS